MVFYAAVKFTNAGEADAFAKKLMECPEAEAVEEAGQLEQFGNIIAVRAADKKAVKGILEVMAKAIRVRKPRKPKKSN